MNRPIKFRAWVESQNYMAYQGTPDLETIQSFMHHFGDKPLMQFTGIRDKNRKEIYEGDYLNIGDGLGFATDLKGNNVIYEVKFVGCEYILYRNDLQLRWGKLSVLAEMHWECKVVGNIHENKL